MTDALAHTLSATVSLDATDVGALIDTGVLAFPLGDQQFELHTRPRPTADPYAVRITPEAFKSLRTAGEVSFRRPWGRLTVAMALEEAR